MIDPTIFALRALILDLQGVPLQSRGPDRYLINPALCGEQHSLNQRANARLQWVALLFAVSILCSVAIAQDSSADAASANANANPAATATAPSEALPAASADALTAKKLPAAATPHSHAETVLPEVEMFVGETRVFPAINTGRIAVGNGRVMSAAAVDGKEVIVFANAPGTSSLFIWNKQGRTQRMRINIVASEQARQQREVAAFVDRIPNAHATVVGDKVIVEGENLSDADQDRIGELTRRYEHVVNFTGRQGWERMVLMDVKLVEMPTTLLRNLGLRWAPTSEGGVNAGANIDLSTSRSVQSRPGLAPIDVPFPSRSVSGYIGLNTLLSAQLQLLEQKGDAVMLAEPQLSTRSGSTATFLAGGEIPYQAVGKDGVASIVFRPYGVIVKITPRVDRQGNIRSSIDLEVSSVDSSVTSSVGPALRSRKTSTEFNLRADETLALSGFLSREQATDIDKVPGLGNLPILGTLFRSKRFQRRETEMVVLVTPRLISSNTPAIQQIVATAHAEVAKRFPEPPKLIVPTGPPVSTLSTVTTLKPASVAISEPALVPKSVSASVPAVIVPRAPAPAPALVLTPVVAPATQPAVPDKSHSPPGTYVERWETTNSGFRKIQVFVPTIAKPDAGAVPAPAITPLAVVPVALDIPQRQPMQVQIAGLVMRRAPNLKAGILQRFRKGQIIMVEPPEADVALSAWRRVAMGDLEGWSAIVHLAPLSLSGAPIAGIPK